MKTILSRANVIDCVEPRVRPDTAVLIENGRIRAILPSREAGSIGDAQTINLKGAYLMPGLWDVHIHPDLGLRLPRFSGRLVGLWVTSWSWWPACRLRRLSASGIPGPNAVARGYTNPRCS